MPIPPAQLTGRLADRDSWTAHRCSVARALEVVGTRSAMLIMREATYGTTRFDDFVHRVGVTESVAAARLRELVDAGLLERRPYRDAGARTRYEYVLSQSGADFVPALLALMQWGDKYLAGSRGAPLALTHTGCGAPVTVEVRCAAGHDAEPGDLTIAAASRANRRATQPAG